MYFSSKSLAAFFAAATTAGRVVSATIPIVQAHIAEPIVVGVASSTTNNSDNKDATKRHDPQQDLPLSVRFKSIEHMDITPQQIVKIKDALVGSSKKTSYYSPSTTTPNGGKTATNDDDDAVRIESVTVTQASVGPLAEDLDKLANHELPIGSHGGVWNGHQYHYELTTMTSTSASASDSANYCGCQLCSTDTTSVEQQQHGGGGGCGCETCDGQNGCDKDCDCRLCTAQELAEGNVAGCGCNLCSRFGPTEGGGAKNAALLQWERQFCEALYYKAGQDGGVFDCTIDIPSSCGSGEVDANAIDTEVKN